MSFYKQHEKTLIDAIKAIKSRQFYTPYFEVPSSKVYGETAKEDGVNFLKGLNGDTFNIAGHPSKGSVTGEKSPYGFDLNISYPSADVDTLVDASSKASASWKNATNEDRIGVCLEALDRLNKASFKMANAVMHTTGQAFMMAFQAGGPHAQDRGLEAVAYSALALDSVGDDVTWQKPISKDDVVSVAKTFKARGRGIGVIIGCSTFPTWNTYPALFASLATGNTVIIKPHSQVILPVALTVSILRDVLSEAGFDPNTVLMAGFNDRQNTQDLLQHSAVKLIDYTGGNTFGDWIENNCKGAQVFTEKAGVNTITIQSTNDFKGMCRNIGFSLSLYAGQMCTAPQNIYIAKDGIETDDGHKSFDDVVAGIATGVSKLLGDDDRACQVLGAIQSTSTAERVASVSASREVVLASRTIAMTGFDNARIITPAILKATGVDDDVAREECFGPVSFVVPADDANSALNAAATVATEMGAITASVYSTDDNFINDAEEKFADAGANLAINFTGGVHVNQSAAFSDYHVSGRNPSGNASLTDLSFVSPRFTISAVRKFG